MAWIKVIPQDKAEGQLKKLYEQVVSKSGHIDNVLQIHSLQPRTLHAHLVLYKAVLHTNPNKLSYRERELVGSYVSMLNGCEYCVQHHTAGLGRIIEDQNLAIELVKEANNRDDAKNLTEREKALCDYSEKLALHPQMMKEEDLFGLRDVGLSDTGILDLNQIIAYFCYVNRLVTGLGVRTEGEPLGLNPSQNEDGFGHS